MNKINLTYLVVLVATFVVSCKKDDNNPETSLKKVSAVVYIGGDSTAFVYDASGNLSKTLTYNKNRVQIYQEEYGYSNNNLVSKIMYYFYNSSKILENKDTAVYSNGKVTKTIGFSFTNNKFVPRDTTDVTYNSNNQLSKLSRKGYSVEYTYNNSGNASSMKTTSEGSATTTNYEYDNKINPFKGHNFTFNEKEFFSNNNVTKSNNTYGTVNFSFEYDADGYPVKVTETSPGEVVTSKIYYK